MQICRTKRCLLALTVAVAGVTDATLASRIDVSLQTDSSSMQVGQTMEVQILADSQDSILGFSFDLAFDPRLLSLKSVTLAGPFEEMAGSSQSQVVGLAYPETPAGSMVLATAVFRAEAVGQASVDVRIDRDNLAEGFPLLGGGFAELDSEPLEVRITRPTVVPEPSSLLALAAGSGLWWRRRRVFSEHQA